MTLEDSVHIVVECLNCQTINNLINEFCFTCGVILITEKPLCSKCNNLLDEDRKKCNICNKPIREKENAEIMKSELHREEKNRFIDIIYDKKSREYIRKKYGEEEFDKYTGYIDWDLLGLFEIVEGELEYLATAKYLLGNDSSEILLEKYSLKKDYDFEKKVRKITDNLNTKIESEKLLQLFPEVGIGFSIVADVYNRFFYFENRVFEKEEEADLARNMLRALVRFYSSLSQNPYVKDEENVTERKLILYSTILFELTYCRDLGDSLSDKQYFECEHIINERLMRGAVLYKMYKIKKFEKTEDKKIRRLCREIITDIDKALKLQWKVKGKETKPIFELYAEKLFEFAEEGIELQYFEILEAFLSNMYYMYEGAGPFPWGESKQAVPYLIKIIEILNGLREKEVERRERIGAYIRAYDFYRNNREYVALEMMRDEKITHVIMEFFVKYYEINSKIDKDEGIKNEVKEIISYIDNEKEKERILRLVR